MKFKLVVVGKIKEDFYRQAIAEYTKRLSRFATTEIVEVEECFFNGEPNKAQIDKIMETEAKAILAKAEGCLVAFEHCNKCEQRLFLGSKHRCEEENGKRFEYLLRNGSYNNGDLKGAHR